ncbi:hypothetical protein HK104_007365 [Borealophlyctis nickersoniae]|nr:hypothetical protein HK104_007365 [Borealophlyctis nickersoniae]
MGRTIRQVIENICMIQGLFVDPNTPGGEVGEIIKRLELFLLEEGSHNESESMARSPHGQDFRTAQPLLSPPPLPPRTMGTTNLANYTGTWTLKGRHLYHEDVLAAQGVSYASRKLIAYNQGVANLVGLNYVIFNDIVADKDVKLRDCMPTLAVDYTWLVDGQEHEIPQVFFGAVKYVCSRNDRGFIVLRTWSGTWGAKKKWENLAVWEVNGDTMIRKNVFKSPKLNKEFELVFTKKA